MALTNKNQKEEREPDSLSEPESGSTIGTDLRPSRLVARVFSGRRSHPRHHHPFTWRLKKKGEHVRNDCLEQE